MPARIIREEVDALVVGAGLAGLTAALAMAGRGLSTLCIDRAAPPPTDRAQEGADLRTTAFLRPAIETLETVGAWRKMAATAAPLNTMRIIDAGGRENVAREQADFAAAEIQDGPFGWNVSNTAIRRALLARVEEVAGCDLRAPVEVTDLVQRDDVALARLSDGTNVAARLLIAADGRNSELAGRVGVGRRRWGYGQKALVFTVGHPRPHEGVSTEIHRTGGPFTMVPLPDEGEGHLSAVVWMERAGSAMGLMELDEAAFTRALEERSLGILGPLTLASRRAIWPIISQIADRLTGPRTALIAEAAHVVPPIGAQGLNMSLADVAALAGLAGDAVASGQNPGAPSVLNAYHRRRWLDITAHVAGIDALNRAAIVGEQPLRDLRRMGLRMLHGAQPLRRMAMKAGLGARGAG